MGGVLLGSTLVYMLHKSFGDRLRRFFIKKLNLDLEKIAHSGKVTLIILMLYYLPAIPYGMICFFTASMGMSYRRFIALTALGTLPSVCIGVALGHMTVVSDWVVSVCIFAGLILLVMVIFWKKEGLFSKLNSYADANKKVPQNRVRETNSFVMTIMYYAVKLYFFICGVQVKSVNKVGEFVKPSIILCNHGSFVDFFYAAAMLWKSKPHFIAARLYFYNTYLGWLLRTLGAFPKSMFATDMENARNCFTVLRNKWHLAMMPEARLSTAGRFEDIQDNTYSFIKKAGVNVYTLKINGGYLSDPKWGKGFRRGAVVETELDILYTTEQIKSLSQEQVNQGINQRLFYDEFAWLQQHPEIHYRSKRMAEGLENILMTCPVCKQKHTIATKGDKVFCEHCGYLTSLNDRYEFNADFQFANIAEWYDWQKALMESEIADDEQYALSSKVELRLPGSGKGLTRHGGEGVCTLNRDGLTYFGTKDEETVELHFSIQRIYRLLFGAGENFEIYNGSEILYFVPEEKRSAVDWYMASMILHDKAMKLAA
jgi:1-acyl-sn-glycerol-3-phosphate acyltransferase